MSNLKLSVTIVLPGSTMMTSQVCDENPEKNYNKHFMLLDVKKIDRKTKRPYYVKEPINFQTRKCVEAKQVINMYDEAYNYMTSTTCPSWYNPHQNNKSWKGLSKKQRLEEHLDRVCKSMGGIYFSYVVFED